MIKGSKNDGLADSELQVNFNLLGNTLPGCRNSGYTSHWVENDKLRSWTRERNPAVKIDYCVRLAMK